jgi:hypothetical protein
MCGPKVRTHACRSHADAGGLMGVLPPKILKSRCSGMRFQANPDDIKSLVVTWLT